MPKQTVEERNIRNMSILASLIENIEIVEVSVFCDICGNEIVQEITHEEKDGGTFILCNSCQKLEIKSGNVTYI